MFCKFIFIFVTDYKVSVAFLRLAKYIVASSMLSGVIHGKIVIDNA